MNKYIRFFVYMLVIAVAFTATDVWADVFSQITGRLVGVFTNVRNIIFIVGGFGLIGLGWAAIFGKIKWPWLAALACGLAIVALAGAVVNYVTKDASTEDATWSGTEEFYQDSMQ
ncbi:MAG: TrbC/VirB2 family protein [Alphaproteobacteria bacterium]|nr:hypothetical protein [Alphaproteobacteria bacterium]MBR3912660.1 TrbC/VirB2 family protein [Alphaproteobacteria bacterium]MBR4931805.1 TrbC/VirB2 family protein [Alphaproteobacteria bacterium]